MPRISNSKCGIANGSASVSLYRVNGRRFWRLNLTMAKKGIKVQDLARDLGLTSRQLVDRCRDEGLSVQNSITKLKTEHERLVRSWFAPKKSTAESS